MKFKQIIKIISERSFFNLKGNTSISNLKKAIEFFKKNPDGKIKTGIWEEPEWDKKQFDNFLRIQLNKKITSKMGNVGRKFSDEYSKELELDRQFIQRYLYKNIRPSGSGYLRTKEMKKKYPYIDIINKNEI